MVDPSDIIMPDNALHHALEASVGRMGGAPRMGPPPTPEGADFGPVGDEAAAPPEPPPQVQPVPVEGVSPAPVPPAGPFKFIDMNNFIVVTEEGEAVSIVNLEIQKTLMMICRNTVWFANNDKFIAMSEKYGLPLPQVAPQEAPDGQAPLPEVPSKEGAPEVPQKTESMLPVQPAKRRRKK